MAKKTLDEIVGGIEDELRQIKAAREQVEVVLGVSNSLSDSLQNLANSSENLVRASSEETRQAAASIKERAAALSDEMAALKSFAAEAEAAISGQARSASEAVEEAAETIAKSAVSTIEKTAIRGIESIAGSSAKVQDGLQTAESLLSDISKRAEDSSLALLKASEKATDASKDLIKQTRVLLDDAKEQLDKIESDVVLIKAIDYEGIKKTVEELKEEQERQLQMQKKRFVDLYVLAGICIAVGLLTLVKLFAS